MLEVQSHYSHPALIFIFDSTSYASKTKVITSATTTMRTDATFKIHLRANVHSIEICAPRESLSDENCIGKIGVDTAENNLIKLLVEFAMIKVFDPFPNLTSEHHILAAEA